MPVRDSDSLRDAISQIISNSELGERLGNNARECLLKNFDQELVIHKVVC